MPYRLPLVKPHGGGYRRVDAGVDEDEAVRKDCEEKESGQQDHLHCDPFHIAAKVWLEYCQYSFLFFLSVVFLPVLIFRSKVMCHDDPCEQNQGSRNDEHGDTAPPHKGDLQKT